MVNHPKHPKQSKKPTPAEVKCSCSRSNNWLSFRSRHWREVHRRPDSVRYTREETTRINSGIPIQWGTLSSERKEEWKAYAAAKGKLECPFHGLAARLRKLREAGVPDGPIPSSSSLSDTNATSGIPSPSCSTPPLTPIFPDSYDHILQADLPPAPPRKERAARRSRRKASLPSTPYRPRPATGFADSQSAAPHRMQPFPVGSSSPHQSNWSYYAPSISQHHPYSERPTYLVDQPQDFLAQFTWDGSSAAVPHDFPTEHGAHAQPFLHPSSYHLSQSYDTAAPSAGYDTLAGPPHPQSQPLSPHSQSAWDEFLGEHGLGSSAQPADAATGPILGSEVSQSAVSPAASYPPVSVARRRNRNDSPYPSANVRFNPYSCPRTRDAERPLQYLAPPATFAPRSPLPVSHSSSSASPHSLTLTYSPSYPHSLSSAQRSPAPPTPDLSFAGSPASWSSSSSAPSSGRVGTPYPDFDPPVEIPSAPDCSQENSIEDELFKAFCPSFFPDVDGASGEDSSGMGNGAEPGVLEE